jgi:hypothetical protein
MGTSQMSRFSNNGRGRPQGNGRSNGYGSENGNASRAAENASADVVQPVFELTYPGGVRAAIWENDGKDGGLYYSITISRRYRDQKDGEWKSGSRFTPNELLAVAVAAQQAFIWCMEHPLEREAQGGDRQGS